MATIKSDLLGNVTIPDDDVPDAFNPKYIFSTTATALLVAASRGNIELVRLAKTELANRGLDEDGKCVGFKIANEIHSKPTVIEQIKELASHCWTGDEMQALLEQL